MRKSTLLVVLRFCDGANRDVVRTLTRIGLELDSYSSDQSYIYLSLTLLVAATSAIEQVLTHLRRAVGSPTGLAGTTTPQSLTISNGWFS